MPRRRQIRKGGKRKAGSKRKQTKAWGAKEGWAVDSIIGAKYDTKKKLRMYLISWKPTEQVTSNLHPLQLTPYRTPYYLLPRALTRYC